MLRTRGDIKFVQVPAVCKGDAALTHELQDLPPRVFIRLSGGAIALLEFSATRMWVQIDVSGHAPFYNRLC